MPDATLQDVKADIDAIGRLVPQVIGEFSDKIKAQQAGLAARLAELEQKYVRIGQGGASSASIGGGRSLGTALANSDRFKQWREGGAVGKVMVGISRSDLDLAQVYSAPTPGAAGSASVLVAPDFEREIVGLQMRPLRIRDLLRAKRTTSNMVWYTQQLTRINNASVVTEGGLKPESEITFELKQATVEVIAHYVIASKQSLDDVEALGAFLDTELRYGLALVEEQELLFGSGVTPHLFGLVPQAAPYEPAFIPEGATALDTILLGILQAELALFPTTGIVLNPVDLRKLQTLKSTIGTYLGAGPWQAGQATLWGVPVAKSLSMPEGNWLLGAFGLGAILYDREDAQIYLSTETNDAFIRNQVYCLAEQRETLTVPRPNSLVYGSFGAGGTG
jgi:HK97 family phage major capsid protein